jgi:hypothetical protein
VHYFCLLTLTVCDTKIARSGPARISHTFYHRLGFKKFKCGARKYLVTVRVLLKKLYKWRFTSDLFRTESEIWDSDAVGFLMNVQWHPSWNLVGNGHPLPSSGWSWQLVSRSLLDPGRIYKLTWLVDVYPALAGPATRSKYCQMDPGPLSDPLSLSARKLCHLTVLSGPLNWGARLCSFHPL